MEHNSSFRRRSRLLVFRLAQVVTVFRFLQDKAATENCQFLQCCHQLSNCWIFKCHVGVLEAAVIQLQNFEDTPIVDGENYIKESLGMYESL